MIAAAAAAAAAAQSLSCPKSLLGYRTPRGRGRGGSKSFTYAAAAAATAAREQNSDSDSGSGSGGSDSGSSSQPATLYDVLGVPAFAGSRDIKAAYRRLARERHPDVAAEQNGGGGPAEEFIRIHTAYATLSDPDKRAEYDRDVMRRRRRPPSGCSRVCSYGGAPTTPGRMPVRTWETDQCW